MNINSLLSFSSKLRLGGLASGLDTDQLVSDLMKAERIPYDNLSRKRQLAEWKRDAYRDITSLLRGLKSEYMDILKPSTNMLSQNSYKKYTVSTIDSATGTASAVVSASGSSAASSGSHTVIVNRMATADTAESMASFIGTPLDFSSGIDLSNRQFTLSINGGQAQTISFGDGASFSDIEELAASLQSLINNSVGAGKVGVSFDSANRLYINTAGGTNTLTAGGADLALIGIAAGTMTYAGVTTPVMSTENITSPLTEAADIQAMKGKQFKITLDGVTKTITIGDYSDMAALSQGLQNSINTAFGSGKINVSVQDGYKLQFTTASNSVNSIILSSGSSGTDGLGLLKISSGDSNRLNTGLSLQELANKFSVPLEFSGGSTSITSNADIGKTTWKGKKLNITVDDVTREIEIKSEPANLNELAALLNAGIKEQFGTAAVTVANSPGGRLTFTKGANTGYFSFSSASSDDALSVMNIEPGATTAGQLKFSINSKEFTFSASQSLASMMNTINSDSTANVKMSYDPVTDKFRLTAVQTGAGNNISIIQTAGNFFDGASGISTVNNISSEGVDAEVVIDGQALIRSSNTFSVNGINYTLTGEKPGVVQNVTLSSDVNSIYDNISKFVTKYNEVIDTINKKLVEESGKDYQPLTQEEKNALSEDEIKRWEEKAKSGLLRNDTLLQGIVYKMRNALIDAVGGESLSLSAIGITTGGYEEKGKLIIDETKLKAAIEKNPDGVMNLFSKKSSTYSTYSRSMTSSQRDIRYREEGLIQRLSDIIDDNTSIFRDSNGNKGALLEKAGMIGDSSDINNALYDQIAEYDKRMAEMYDRLVDKENNYYKKFTNLETMMQKMNQQSSWLAQQLGQAGGQ